MRADPRRSAAEVPWITAVKLAPGGEGQLINISRVGALVASDTRLVPGTSVTVWFAGIPGQHPLTAGVVRCEVAAIGRDGKLFYRSGIAFGQHLELEAPARQEQAAVASPTRTPAQAFVEERGAEDQDREARLRAAEARCQELDELHAAERREWESLLHAAEARSRELGDQHQAERSKWEDALRAAEARLEDLAAQHAREHADLERALLEAEATCQRLEEEQAAARDQWDHAFKQAETQREQLNEQCLTEAAEWQERLCEVEARYAQLVERHRAAQAELEKQVEEANGRQRMLEQYAAERAELENTLCKAESERRRLVEEHAAERTRLEEAYQQAQAGQELLVRQHLEERSEWERALQEGERRRESESVNHQAECDRLSEALAESRSRCRSLLDHAPYPAYVCDAEGSYLRANGSLHQLLGYASEAELGAVNFLEEVFASPGDAGRVAAGCRHPDGIQGVEVEWTRKDGVKLTVRLSGRRLSGDPEAPDATEIIVNDVTRLRALEAQARRYATLETTMVELTQASRGLQKRLTAFLRGVDEVAPGEV